MVNKIWIVAFVAFAGLSACLDTDLERGLAGAAAGAITADALGVDPVIGAAAGGLAGATCDSYASACR
ncbi:MULTISPECIES: hypothetical protein [unclassified Marivivens]|jgi:hypothetical protein|uniref:hypothetical protein n=1 Tax=unclassified Marivivens TaxID=2622455 RepID=UPI0007FF8E92|nr:MULTISPECIES: hypothetical protein [unclassified Marivivens]APO87048.1 hypothetical protein BSK21_08380 [Marivivens sp. JLT3646]NVJ95990.1 hypothetical protein [Marivivens sp.]NVK07393.1 hypothetical protein [Marivivens sp.]OBR39775.1 hypothetical protein A9199_02065 [Donghicola sp. JL3646]